MKLLFFSFEMPALLKDKSEISGGAAVQWKSWIKGFLDCGHEFGLLTFKGAQNYINKKFSFEIIETYDPNYGIKKLRLFYYQIPTLYKKIKDSKPDYIIQAAATNHTFMLMIVSKLTRIPFIHRIASDVHVDDRISSLVKSNWDIFLYRLGQKYSSIIFTQNTYQSNKLKKLYPNKKIFVLHNPFELQSRKSEILPRSERKYISWVGNFRKIKNLPALAEVAKRLPEINFKIAGAEHKNLDEETIYILSELKSLKNVEFIGYLNRSEMKPFLGKSIAILNTSINEGFSNTFLEAWSLGIPVITTKFVNPDELINKYNLGLVADDYDGLSGLVARITDMSETNFNDLADHCFDYVSEKHNPKKLAEKFISYLKDN